jgi:NADH-quinone oxidoreductase subunit L
MLSDWIVLLAAVAWLAPAMGFVVGVCADAWSVNPRRDVPWLGTAGVAIGLVASLAAVVCRVVAGDSVPEVLTGDWYRLARFGALEFSVGYYLDSLALAMLVVVALVSTAVHLFALGYLAEESQDRVVDHEAHGSTGGVARPGRLDRFYIFLSLFTWSMQGLVLANNLLQLFVFWELVGACSYFLIGFYFERAAAQAASLKAFVMNRVGDAGLLLGLAILATSLGTLEFRAGEHALAGAEEQAQAGLFDQIRGQEGDWRIDLSADGSTQMLVLRDASGGDLLDSRTGGHRTLAYGLLTLAGFCVVAGVIGKSAQVPLHTWLPDAMAGPTPVSALVHSATMVAAGVFLVARLAPILVPEVLVVIAYLGAVTLILGAVLAMTADDIKQVLAFSTISQLGYMLVGLGCAGWDAGVFHLVTHAFFKSLLFLGAGSVIIALHHEQDLKRMGGLARVLPWTAGTMLVGVIAITGLAVPLSEQVLGEAIALSGYHSKDAILAAALAFVELNPRHTLVFALPALGAGLTSFYMFRLWLAVFAGRVRPEHAEVREPGWLMRGPLVVLAVCAMFAGVGGEHGPLATWLGRSAPVLSQPDQVVAAALSVTFPGHEATEAVHGRAAAFGLTAAIAGAVLAWATHRLRQSTPEPSVDWTGRIPSPALFDAVYAQILVAPVHRIAALVAQFDERTLDGLLHRLAAGLVLTARADRRVDEQLVDGLVRLVGRVPPAAGDSLRRVQTGQLRHYVAFVVAGAALVGLLGILAVGR